MFLLESTGRCASTAVLPFARENGQEPIILHSKLQEAHLRFEKAVIQSFDSNDEIW